MSKETELRWYADQVERVTFSEGRVLDKPNYRLQQWKQVGLDYKWVDVPCEISPNAIITEVDFTTS